MDWPVWVPGLVKLALETLTKKISEGIADAVSAQLKPPTSEVRVAVDGKNTRKLLPRLGRRSLGDMFVGREHDLQRIRTHFDQRGGEGGTRPLVLTANGGTGKSRLAIEYAWRGTNSYDQVFFVTADSGEALMANLARLCREEYLNLAAKNDTEEAAQTKAVLGWLATHDRWLMILDNIDTAAAVAAVEGLQPSWVNGDVLITSRRTHWHLPVMVQRVEKLQPGPAMQYLLDRTFGHRVTTVDDEKYAETVANRLGLLPAALEQAAGYIKHRHISFATYMSELEKQRQAVLKWHNTELLEYPLPIALAYETSLEQLTSPAMLLLNTCAWLSAEPIPLSLFDLLPELEGESEEVALLRECDVLEIVGELTGLCLVERGTSPTWTIVLHPLLLEALRFRMSPQQQRTSQNALVQLLLRSTPELEPMDVRSWPFWNQWRQHLVVVLDLVDSQSDPALVSLLLSLFGNYLFSRALFPAAEQMMKRALQIDEILLGPEHPRVATQLNNLSQVLQATNQTTEAEAMLVRSLAIVESHYGPNHPTIATGLNNLSAMMFRADRCLEAEPLLRRALQIMQDFLGEGHPSIAVALNNLAQVLRSTDRVSEAESLMRRALEIDKAHFGPSHPNSIRGFNNLASLLRSTEREAEAEILLRQTLAIDEANYGLNHPRVALVLNNLAQLLRHSNRLEEAEPMLKRAYEIMLNSYGEEHPDTKITFENWNSIETNLDTR